MGQTAQKLIEAFHSPLLSFKFLIWEIRSIFYYKYINDGRGKIVFRNTSAKLIIKKGKNSRFNLHGTLSIVPFLNDNSPIVIEIADGAVLNIFGDFIIGEGVKISLSTNSYLSFGGRKYETGSGITGRTLIMVNKRIEIGVDFLCAWDVYLTDSDWHTINKMHHQKDVFIGDHVWIANNSNILKGSILGHNCIVGSCSKIVNKSFDSNLLIGGIPAKILKENITWSREMK